MTQWGFGLLFAYVAFGASNLAWRRARRWVLASTALVVVAVFASYGAVR